MYEYEFDFAHARMKNNAACGLSPAACAAPCAAAIAAAYVACWALRQVYRGGRAQQANLSANAAALRPHDFSRNFMRSRVHTSMLHASEIAGDSLLPATN